MTTPNLGALPEPVDFYTKDYTQSVLYAGSGYTKDQMTAYALAAIAADRASRAQSEWISVEDRLPAVNEKVLFYRAEGFCFGWRVTDTEWTDDSFQDRDGSSVSCYGVMHWMPQPPKPATTGETK